MGGGEAYNYKEGIVMACGSFSGNGDGGGLLPGLPHDLALLCLARLPCRLYPLARGVSRAWSQALEAPFPSASPSPSSAPRQCTTDIHALRRAIGANETWLLAWVRTFWQEFRWFLLDPSSASPPLRIAHPPCTPSSEGVDFRALSANGGRVLLVAEVGVCGASSSISASGKHWMCFDALRRQWSCIASPPSSLSERTFCAYSPPLSDGCIYAAGGCFLSEDWQMSPLKSAERMDVRHGSIGSWERMPDMHRVRMGPAGAVLNDYFYVIGGYGGSDLSSGVPTMMEHSGEIWDPKGQEWKLVPELWPEEIFGRSGYAFPSVAVVEGHLFALRPNSEEVMAYDSCAKAWTSVGCFPLDGAARENNPMLTFSLYGVGKELWVVRSRGNAGAETPILRATVPSCGRQQPLVWSSCSFGLAYKYFFRGFPVQV